MSTIISETPIMCNVILRSVPFNAKILNFLFSLVTLSISRINEFFMKFLNGDVSLFQIHDKPEKRMNKKRVNVCKELSFIEFSLHNHKFLLQSLILERELSENYLHIQRELIILKVKIKSFFHFSRQFKMCLKEVNENLMKRMHNTNVLSLKLLTVIMKKSSSSKTFNKETLHFLSYLKLSHNFSHKQYLQEKQKMFRFSFSTFKMSVNMMDVMNLAIINQVVQSNAKLQLGNVTFDNFLLKRNQYVSVMKENFMLPVEQDMAIPPSKTSLTVEKDKENVKSLINIQSHRSLDSINESYADSSKLSNLAFETKEKQKIDSYSNFKRQKVSRVIECMNQDLNSIKIRIADLKRFRKESLLTVLKHEFVGRKLIKLNLARNQLKAKQLLPLFVTPLPKLQCLNLNCNQITSSINEFNWNFKNLENLKLLFIAKNKLSDCHFISNFRELRCLDLSNNYITKFDSVRFLSLNHRLNVVHLENNPINKKERRKALRVQMKQIIPGLKTLNSKAYPKLRQKKQIRALHKLDLRKARQYDHIKSRYLNYK